MSTEGLGLVLKGKKTILIAKIVSSQTHIKLQWSNELDTHYFSSVSIFNQW